MQQLTLVPPDVQSILDDQVLTCPGHPERTRYKSINLHGVTSVYPDTIARGISFSHHLIQYIALE